MNNDIFLGLKGAYHGMCNDSFLGLKGAYHGKNNDSFLGLKGARYSDMVVSSCNRNAVLSTVTCNIYN